MVSVVFQSAKERIDSEQKLTGKRRPLYHHSTSLYQPPLSRSSHSAPHPRTVGSKKPPLFTSYSESRSPGKASGSRRSSSFLNSLSSCQTLMIQRRVSISNQEGDDQPEEQYSVVCISTKISSFMCMSSQIGLHVAQTDIRYSK